MGSRIHPALVRLGWIDGRNVTIEYRWAAGDVQRTTEYAAELARRKVDLIVTSAYGVVASKEATSTIPIIFAAYCAAIANGFAVSLSRPGGNVTGLSIQPSELSSKRLELLREIIPGVRRLAALVNINYAGLKQEVAGIQTASTRMNIDTHERHHLITARHCRRKAERTGLLSRRPPRARGRRADAGQSIYL
ncbi:ABC transporter substrate binding protein [Bradyrhizobium sp. RDM4]|uniref:ABC transporter substrate binding protein n=1 Tax=Bradyrhizobium sp. RDM4 TaxID=3378765 RepID=UPI0038FD194D